MIPIKYRLNSVDEEEYIKKVIKCISNPSDFSENLKAVLTEINQEGNCVGKLVLDDANRFVKKYPNYNVLCAWLVMSYEKIQSIKKFFEERINVDLDDKNENARFIKSNFAKIQSYHGLRKRRKIYENIGGTLYNHLKEPIWYDRKYSSYESFVKFYKKYSEEEINNWIVKKTDMKVCPYCNISYTYSRGKVITAQLDHFYPKSEYPMFALCFYNLIPSCPACNKIKHDNIRAFLSPYKERAFEKLRITWEYEGREDDTRYEENDNLDELEKNINIKILTSNQSEESNISEMKILEAYQEHKDYASEVIKKVKTYANPKAQKLISDICDSVEITPDEITRFYFGNYIEEADLKKRPLSKMTRDFYEEYKKIY